MDGSHLNPQRPHTSLATDQPAEIDHLGEACVFALKQWQPGPEEPQFLNVGTGVDLTIRELAEAVAAATGFPGEILWDTSKPDGTPKKQLDVGRLAGADRPG